MPFMCKKVICFDLDDTLYKEIDFVKSAFGEIASSVGKPELVTQMMRWHYEGENVFQELNYFIGQDKPIAEYLTIYRNHVPNIELSEGVEETLNELAHRGIILGLITDGRSISQRNKIKALRLDRWFNDKNIIISEEFGSEKTDERNFRYYMELYPCGTFCYVGDNPSKDFLAPQKVGWNTICLLDDGRNIHQQHLDVGKEYLPKYKINHISELIAIISE